MRCLLLAALLVPALSGVPASAGDPPPRPNILLIVADDLGWADVGWHGGRYRTPVMDRLVQAGVELDRHYVQPVCTPTRAALLSGRWTSRWGPHVLTPCNLRAFPPGTVTLASALKSAGYATFLSGKWHLGVRPEWGPNRYGFDRSYGSMAGAADPWTHQYRPGPHQKTWHRDGELIDEEGNATELVARQAVEWIRLGREPWFVYVPFQAVHIPVDAPDEYKKLYEGVKFHDDPERQDAALRYAAFVTQLDAKVGDLVRALEETGQRERTLLVFLSDNGGLLSGGNPYVSRVPGSPVAGDNRPLRGQKATLYEGGVRVGAFANWPGVLSPRRVAAFLHAADWMPTLTRLAGWSPPDGLKWDGRDVWPVLAGKEEDLPSRALYIPYPGSAAVLRDGWKLIVRRVKGAEKVELYDVKNDPSEKEDRAALEPGRVADLKRVLEDLRKDDLPEVPADLRRAREE